MERFQHLFINTKNNVPIVFILVNDIDLPEDDDNDEPEIINIDDDFV